jgi:hypothetical protein
MTAWMRESGASRRDDRQPRGAAMIGSSPVRHLVTAVTTPVVTGFLALVLALPLAGCSYLNWNSGPSEASTTGGDDARCQADGYRYGTPEYTQCRQYLDYQHMAAEHAEARPYYVPQR